jgi:putative transposase
LTGSVAVGSRAFVEKVKAFLGFRAKGREVVQVGDGYQIREGTALYNSFLRSEEEPRCSENTYTWNVKP